MQEKQNSRPTPAEMEILQILWKKAPLSVREVNEQLNKTREVGYTTTLKIMQLMHDKNLLERESLGKKHIYSAILKQESVKKSMLDKILNGAFGGSTYDLVMEALGNYRASKEELESIKELIEKIEGGRK